MNPQERVASYRESWKEATRFYQQSNYFDGSSIVSFIRKLEALGFSRKMYAYVHGMEDLHLTAATDRELVYRGNFEFVAVQFTNYCCCLRSRKAIEAILSGSQTELCEQDVEGLSEAIDKIIQKMKQVEVFSTYHDKSYFTSVSTLSPTLLSDLERLAESARSVHFAPTR